MDITNKRVLITGASSGIGRALGISLGRFGCKVAACARNKKSLENTASQHPHIKPYRADITKRDDRLNLYKQIKRDMDGIDVLVNNAGRMVLFDSVVEIPDTIENEIDLNFSAPVELIRLFLPQLLKAPESAIINVTSGLALWPNKSAPVYCASKAALHSFTKSLRWQLEKTTVRVIEVLPPLVQTPSATKKGGISPNLFAKRVVEEIKKGISEIKLEEVKLLAIGRHISPFVTDAFMKNK
ncbi:short-chain dehydrogenase [Chitinispirillum alkaliphilum]|nr:short-chain dehydrogenase [Chitinispirillum alkaliphilum]